ncbi:MAG TPA: cupin domain-containing protein [Thermoleophilia bacterium]|nr:cupin domain-containing protein [Thermoleophilia bacterium]
MTDEAHLEELESGLAPVTDGWFVVNARDAAWRAHPEFGARCNFELHQGVIGGRDDLQAARFPQIGVNLDVVWPGQPASLYHAETEQEDFLVLAGECVAVLEDEQRTLHAWDLVHCPPGTHHVLIGAGDGPCVILMLGARPNRGIDYPRSEVALKYGAGVETPTDSPTEAYAPHEPWRPARPARWDELPWARGW